MPGPDVVGPRRGRHADTDRLVDLEEAAAAPPKPPLVLAVQHGTNAELIAEVAKLGYLRQRSTVIDPTYGEGKWWTIFRPDNLICHDLFKLDGVDFRHLPEGDMCADAVALDAPYVASGGRETSTIDEMNDRYGIGKTIEHGGNPTTPAENQDLMHGGMKEALRVLKPKGILLVKCMDYITSGHLWPATHYAIEYGLDLGFEYLDRFEHVGGTGPQPDKNLDGSDRIQVHARRNLSTLLVFRAPRRKQASSLFDP